MVKSFEAKPSQFDHANETYPKKKLSVWTVRSIGRAFFYGIFGAHLRWKLSHLTITSKGRLGMAHKKLES